MAYSMVTVYGMNKEIGNISFYDSKSSDYNFQKPYSDATAERIDKEVKRIIDECYERTIGLLSKHRQHLEVIANELLQKEILFQTDLERLIGKRPFEKPTTYQQFTNGSATKKDEVKEEPKAETTASEAQPVEEETKLPPTA
jgi:cell division protease FtsH